VLFVDAQDRAALDNPGRAESAGEGKTPRDTVRYLDSEDAAYLWSRNMLDTKDQRAQPPNTDVSNNQFMRFIEPAIIVTIMGASLYLVGHSYQAGLRTRLGLGAWLDYDPIRNVMAAQYPIISFTLLVTLPALLAKNPVATLASKIHSSHF
jgi:hypothetical protein